MEYIQVDDKNKFMIRLGLVFPLSKLSTGSPSQCFDPPIVMAHAPTFQWAVCGRLSWELIGICHESWPVSYEMRAGNEKEKTY